MDRRSSPGLRTVTATSRFLGRVFYVLILKNFKNDIFASAKSAGAFCCVYICVLSPVSSFRSLVLVRVDNRQNFTGALDL